MSIFKIRALPAQEGDCLLVSWGEDQAQLRHMIVDGGRRAAAAALHEHLERAGIRSIEVLVVSHVDADHIEGMLTFLEDARGVEIGQVWFNGYRHLIDLQSQGAVQGERLTRLLAGMRWNTVAGGRAIRVDDDGAPRRLPALPGGLEVTVLSPDRSRLARLMPVWERECDRAGIGLAADEREEEEAVRPGLQAMGGNLEDLADTPTPEDGSVANGTSIALLLEFQGRRALLAADAHPDLLVDSLSRLNGGDPVRLDLLKVPHHGSAANITRSLLAALDCERFLISTSGARFGHPDRVAVARMILAGGAPELHFNYDQPHTAFWRSRTRAQGEPAYTCNYPAGADGIEVLI